MSILHSKTDRRILPRWRLSKKASRSAEFFSTTRTKQVTANTEIFLNQAADDFERSPTIGMAAGLISSALLAGKTEKSEVAVEFVLEHENDSPHALLSLAKTLSNKEASDETELSHQISVAQTRELLRVYPNSPVLWSDMARHFASISNKKQAYRCMQTALKLAPDHRWMLRTSARFLVHQGDPIAAHKLLAQHSRTRHDPWLIAAELACAQVAGRPPKFWRQAGDILKRDSVAPVHFSELATAVAMMDLEAGEMKKARKCVNKGLVSPTENTLAQVFWAKENRHLNDGFKLDELVRSAKDAYEADYQLNLANGELLKALASAETWADDEPFAARPKSEIAYIASLLDNYDLVIKMASDVERLDSHKDPTLMMNSIFATLSSGKYSLESHGVSLERLCSKLTSVANENKDSYHALANLGLWHYRYGDKAKGKDFYQKAILITQKLHLTEAAALAATFLAREAILARDDSAGDVLQQAKELSKKSKSKASEFYVRKLDVLFQNPSKASDILSPQSAKQFIKAESKLPLYRVEKTEEGHVLWVPPKKINR